MRCLFATAAAFALTAGLAHAAEVRVVVAEYSAATGPIFDDMAAAFEAEHPDIDIRIEVVPWDNLEQKLLTDIAGGTAPDLSIIGTRWLVGYVEEGVAEPLDDYMSEEFKDRFIDVFLAPSVILVSSVSNFSSNRSNRRSRRSSPSFIVAIRSSRILLIGRQCRDRIPRAGRQAC